MSNHIKALARLCAKPTPTDITWKELKSVLVSFGYTEFVGNGSRRKFINKNKNLVISLHEPHPNPEIKKCYIEYVVEHLKSNHFL